MTTASAAAGATFESPGHDGIGRIVLDRPDDELNALNLELVDALGDAVRAARAYADLRGLIVVSAKPGQFVAGADLNMLSQAPTASDIEDASRRLQAVCDELAWLPCTTVAAIGGPALGGGLELALACDYRVAAEAPSVSLGQPEVNLGIVPAGGGTQRLPRLIGLQAALDLILSGRRLNARRARRAGLVDEVVHPRVLEHAARVWASKPKRALDRPLRLGPNLQAASEVAEQTPVGRKIMYRQARAAVLGRTHGHYPAPLKALEAVEVGLEHGMAAGLDAEARAFGELSQTSSARNLIWLFMATQHQKRVGTRDARHVERLGVVGAGFMGAAIAEVGAVAGLPVRVRDVRPEAVAKGLASIRKIVHKGVDRRRFTPLEGRDIVQRVSGTTDYSGFGMTDLVIEAVFEDLDIKRTVLRELEAVLPEGAVIASNTSALPIHEIATHAQHPERVVGMHFFSPAERMPLLEVVRPTAATDAAVATAVSLGVRMGKTVIVVRDAPGFYTSRVLGVMMNEAALLLGEGARLEQVDRALTAFGFPVGPFVLFDEVGLEVAQHAGQTVARAFSERIPAATIVPALVKAGFTGKRSGSGFYIWPRGSRLPKPLPQPARKTNPAVYALNGGQAARALSHQDIQERLVLLFVNEAIRCLDEGVLQSATDGDLGAVLGLGFPPFHGGPFHYADALGARVLESKLQRLAEQHGPRYTPSELLVSRAEREDPFYPR
jgi:3-hydroxyacyl-CoA dehydrogenase / enoyl-CoA hydratase / 3-hydroxybutyryl-CoA epimerase